MANRQRLYWVGAIATAFVAGGWLYASPYVTLYQMYQAVEHRDTQGISDAVDFPALRESLKENLQTVVQKETAKQANPLIGLLGSALGSAFLNPAIDTMVTPQGVMALLEGQRLQLGGKEGTQTLSEKAADVEVNAQYESFNQFAVSIKPKGENISPVDLLLSRQGLGWKVTGVRLQKL